MRHRLHSTWTMTGQCGKQTCVKFAGQLYIQYETCGHLEVRIYLNLEPRNYSRKSLKDRVLFWITVAEIQLHFIVFTYFYLILHNLTTLSIHCISLNNWSRGEKKEWYLEALIKFISFLLIFFFCLLSLWLKSLTLSSRWGQC